MLPRIAIPVPTSHDEAYNRLNWAAFADAVSASGGEPVKFPLDLTPAQIAERANDCCAILLPGSPADVNPEKYGQEAVEGTAAPDVKRENVDELLLQDAHNLYKPILGVCFGLQILNVWRSGSLVQDLTILPVNHSASGGVAVAHTAMVAPGSLLASIVDPGEAALVDGYLRLPVNSSHHQAIGIPGDGLRVAGRCPQDGVVEALEGGQANSLHAGDASEQNGQTITHPAHFVLGVQWHPERTFSSSPSSRAIFSALVERGASWTPRPVTTSVRS